MQRLTRGLRSVFLFGLALCCLSAFGQDPTRTRGNRVCVVLGGGGALGWAHVGVLKALEENRIPVDCIAGTSAGGLVGGMIAAGMTPSEIESTLLSVPWDDLFTGRPAYNDLPWRRKEDRRAFPFRYEFGLKGAELRLPGGIDPAQQVGLLLSRVALPASPVGRGATLRSFDDLVLPFRCVAVDLNSGTEKVLSGGSLYVALRATMAIPLNFTPVLTGDEVLVDGGLLNNLPVDVAKKAFDPEFILAVKLSGITTPRFGQESLNDILSRSLDIVGEDQIKRHASQADVILEPNLSDYSGNDFDRVQALIDRGYVETKAAIASGRLAKLMHYQLSPEDWTRYQKEMRARRERLNLRPVPQFVRAISTRVSAISSGKRRRANEPWIPVTEAKGSAEAELASRLDSFRGRDLRDTEVADQLANNINKIVGEGRYESIAYEMTTDTDGRQGLLLRAKEKTYAPPFLNFGSDVDTAESNVVHLTLKGRTAFVDEKGNGAETRLSFDLGTQNAVEAEYYKPFARRSLFVAPRAFYSRLTQNVFSSGQQLSSYRSESYGAGLDVGSPLGRQSEIRFGYEFGRLNEELSVGVPFAGVQSGPYSAFRLKYGYDNQDGDLIPSKGLRLDALGRYFTNSPGQSENFAEASARLSRFSAVSRDESVFTTLEGGTTFGVSAPPLLRFSLGGPFRMGAYDVDELQGDNFMYGNVGFLRRVAKLPDPVGGKIFIAGWYELGGVSLTGQDYRIRNCASFGLMIETLLGPVFIGGSVGEAGHRRIYLTLGRSF